METTMQQIEGGVYAYVCVCACERLYIGTLCVFIEGLHSTPWSRA